MLQQKLHLLVTMNKLNFSVIWKISMFINAINKFWSLVMNGLADIDGFKICIQAWVWLGFPPQGFWLACMYDRNNKFDRNNKLW